MRGRLEEALGRGTVDLPLLPQVAMEVTALTSAEDCDARRLAEVIRRDQAIAGNLLRLANSALYRPDMPIVSLQQALARLGVSQVRQLVMAISCKSRIFVARSFEAEVASLFARSFAAALFAQEIARARRSNVEEAFLCGLLQDVAQPVLLQAAADSMARGALAPAREETLAVVEALHARTGGDLARAWAFPARLADAITYHHDPASAPAAAIDAAMTSALARELARLAEDDGMDLAAAVAQHPAVAALNLYPESLTRIAAKRGAVREAVGAA